MEKWIGRLSSIGGAGAATAIALMVLMIILEVLLRLIAGRSTLFAQEYTGYLLVLVTFVSLAQILKKDRHIKITLIISRLPQTCQKILDIFLPILALSVVVYMTFWSFDLFISSLQEMETAETVTATPLFIPKFFVPIGLCLFALQFVAHITERVKKLKVTGT